MPDKNGARSDLEIVLHDGRVLTIDRYAISHKEMLAVADLTANRDKKARYYGHLARALKADPSNMDLLQQVLKAEEEWEEAFDAVQEKNDEKVASAVGLTVKELQELPVPVYGEIQEAVNQVLRRERGVDPN